MTRGSKEWRTQQAKLQADLNDCLSQLAELGLESESGREASSTEDERQQRLRNIAVRLNRIYSDESFRHRYSEIVEVIHRYDRDNAFSTELKLDKANERGAFLQASLRDLLRHECTEACSDECPIKELRGRMGFEKLYDHVSLEAKRAGIDHIRATGIISEIRKAQTDLDAANVKIDEAQTNLNNANQQVLEAQKKAKKALNQAKRLQTETVSVLGVFSAIILAFNASVTFTTSSVSAVDTTPPFNVAFVVAVIGFVLFNCLYAAFSFIYRIIRPDNDPDYIIGAKRIAGIELTALSCALLLGTLAYSYGMSCWPEVIPWAIAISLAVLSGGIALICRSSKEE